MVKGREANSRVATLLESDTIPNSSRVGFNGTTVSAPHRPLQGGIPRTWLPVLTCHRLS